MVEEWKKLGTSINCKSKITSSSNNIPVNYCNITPFRNPARDFGLGPVQGEAAGGKIIFCLNKFSHSLLVAHINLPFDLLHDALLPRRIWGQML